jgi:hypothetical protein
MCSSRRRRLRHSPAPTQRAVPGAPVATLWPVAASKFRLERVAAVCSGGVRAQCPERRILQAPTHSYATSRHATSRHVRRMCAAAVITVGLRVGRCLVCLFITACWDRRIVPPIFVWMPEFGATDIALDAELDAPHRVRGCAKLPIFWGGGWSSQACVGSAVWKASV